MDDFRELRRRAKSAGLPLVELCRRAGIHKTTFFRWERRGAMPLAHNADRVVAVIEEAEANSGEPAE